MRQIKDNQLLEHYLTKFEIRSRFTRQDLPFRLFEYAPGEIMNLLHPNEEYFKFVVRGVFDQYLILPEGNRHMVHHCESYTIQGYLEFSGRKAEGHCCEVLETLHCVELPMQDLRRELEKDPVFLRYLVDYMGFIMSFSLPMHPEFDSLKDALLHHMRCVRSDWAIHSVEDTAARLNCSRRQLLRVLKQLTEEGLIEKTGRGHYRLV